MSTVPPTRDIAADTKAAYIEEHAGYVLAGRKSDAANVAKILKDHYDYDVDKKPAAKKAEAEPEPPVERAVPDASETATPERAETATPVKRGPGRPPGSKNRTE